MGRKTADALLVAPAGLRDGLAVDDSVGRVDADGLGLDADGLGRRRVHGKRTKAREDRQGKTLLRGRPFGEKAKRHHRRASFCAEAFTKGLTEADAASSERVRVLRVFEPGQVEVQVSFQDVVAV